MKKLGLAAAAAAVPALLLAAAVPSAASAQSYRYGQGYNNGYSGYGGYNTGYGHQGYCGQQSDSKTRSAVVGGAIGAVVGSEVAGRGNRTMGALLGAAAGAAIGTQVGKSRDCDNGYAYAPQRTFGYGRPYAYPQPQPVYRGYPTRYPGYDNGYSNRRSYGW